MGAFITALLSKIVSLAAWIAALVVACFAAFWLLGTDLGCWVVEQLLSIVVAALNGFNADFSLFNPGTYISSLPAEITNLLGLLHFGQGMSIILGAVLIKITLQVIPFTRLGS